MLRDPERRKLRLPRAYVHPVASALPRDQVLIQADISPRGRLQIAGRALALPDIDDVHPALFESRWAAQGDGAQHLSVTAEMSAAEGDLAETIAA
jgi:hypothetical protein